MRNLRELMITKAYTGHTHYRSPYECDDDCGTCDGARCEICKTVYEVAEDKFDEIDGYTIIYHGHDCIKAYDIYNKRKYELDTTIKSVSVSRKDFNIRIDKNIVTLSLNHVHLALTMDQFKNTVYSILSKTSPRINIIRHKYIFVFKTDDAVFINNYKLDQSVIDFIKEKYVSTL